MAKVGAQRAAELTGKSKSTIQRAMNAGKIKYELDDNGRKRVDVVELERAFGLIQQDNDNQKDQADPEQMDTLVQLERNKARVQMLEEQLQKAEEQISDIKVQRDQWQQQASQALITSQFAQKQYESLQENVKERERRAHEKRQKRLKEEGRKDKSRNTEKQESGSQEHKDASEKVEKDSFFSSFWQKMKENF